MLIWINGTFGVGKTQTAFELHKRLPGSVVLDPEEIGYALRRITPRRVWPNDFQYLPQWRTAVREHIQWVVGQFDGTVIVPMTMLEPDWHDEIVGGLQRAGVAMAHFTLLADDDVIRARLRKRGDFANHWALEKLAHYSPLMRGLQFAEHLETNEAPVEVVVERIAERAGVSICPRLSALAVRWLRVRTWIRHVR